MDAVVAVNSFNVSERDIVTFIAPLLGYDCQDNAFLFCGCLVPDPVKIDASCLHNLFLHNIDIINGHIVFLFLVTVTHQRMTNKLNKIRLISSQLMNFLDRERVIL